MRPIEPDDRDAVQGAFARLSEPVRPWLAVSGMALFVVVAAGVVLTL